MEESTVEKREYTFLWKIIGAYLSVLVLNILLKQYLLGGALFISSLATGGLGLLLTTMYAISLKPKFNQIVLLIVCIGVTFSAIIFMVFNLPYKMLLAGLSIPLFLTLCGMWIYTKYSKVEIK